MKRPKFHRLISKIHKWVGIVLGIQIMFWVVGGFVMSWFPLEDVRGEHLRADLPSIAISPNTHDTATLQSILAKTDRSIVSWHAEHLNGQGIYRVVYEDLIEDLYDGITAQPIKPFSKKYIRAAARARYAGPGEVTSVELLKKAPIEYRRDLPVWRITFDDSDRTSFYISNETGKLVAVRTDTWRFYDFMWMLHIMDYDERSNFNHPLLYLTSLAAVLFTITGFILFFIRRRKKGQ